MRGMAVFTSWELPVGPPRELTSLPTGALQLMKAGGPGRFIPSPLGSCERVSMGLCNGGVLQRALLLGCGG